MPMPKNPMPILAKRPSKFTNVLPLRKGKTCKKIQNKHWPIYIDKRKIQCYCQKIKIKRQYQLKDPVKAKQ